MEQVPRLVFPSLLPYPFPNLDGQRANACERVGGLRLSLVGDTVWKSGREWSIWRSLSSHVLPGYIFPRHLRRLLPRASLCRAPTPRSVVWKTAWSVYGTRSSSKGEGEGGEVRGLAGGGGGGGVRRGRRKTSHGNPLTQWSVVGKVLTWISVDALDLAGRQFHHREQERG